ncbi:MAG: hypothetical protein WBC05_08620 [Sedimentisphaerales bacterium]
MTILISIVVLSGILYSFRLGENLRYADEKQYYTLAKNIVERHQYSYDGEHSTAYRPPGYPMILSLCIFLGAGTVYLRIMNFIALGLCMYLMNKILTEQSSPLAGTVGALLVVCYPVLFYTAGTLYPQIIGSLLFVIVIFLLTRKTCSYWSFVLGGLLFGYLVLTIPIFLFILPVFAIWLCFSEGFVKVGRILAIVAIACLPIVIWSARNYKVFNAFVLVSSNSGRNLLLGNSENTTPNTGVNVDISKYTAEADRLNLDEVGRDRYYRSKAIEFVLDQKIKAVKLYLQKTLNYFNYSNKLATKGETSAAKDLLMLFTYGPLILIFLSRIFLLKHFKPSQFEVLLVILYFSSALFYAIFFTRIRFRLPFDFILISVVAIFLNEVIQTWIVKHNTLPGHVRGDDRNRGPAGMRM